MNSINYNEEKISVLMSVFKESDEWVIKAANSILSQSYKNIELIVIIDNPTRNISSIELFLSQFGNVIIEINDKNIGLANSLNRAAALANGNYLARMDADDISLPNRLTIQLDFLKKNNLDMVGGAIELINEKEETISYSHLPSNLSLLNKLSKYRTICFHPTWLLKRDVFYTVGGYRSFPAAQDLDFILRALEQDIKISNVNEVILKYRINNNSVSIKRSLIQRRCQRYAHKLSKVRAKNHGVDNFSDSKLNDFMNIGPVFGYLHDKSNKLIQKSSLFRKKNNKILAIIYLVSSMMISYEQFLFIYKAIASKIILKMNKNKLNSIVK